MEISWTNNIADWLTGKRNNRVNTVKNLLKETVKKTINQTPSVRMSDLLRNQSPTPALEIMEIRPFYTSTLQNIILSKSRKSKHFDNSSTEDSSLNISEIQNKSAALDSVESMISSIKENDVIISNVESSKEKNKNFEVEITKAADEEEVENGTQNAINENKNSEQHIYENVEFGIPDFSPVLKPKIPKPKRKYPPGRKPFTNLDESNDSQIINELVLDKYSNVLDYFRHRSFQRSNRKRNNRIADYINEDEHSLMSGFSSALPSTISSTDAATEYGPDFYFEKSNEKNLDIDNSLSKSITIHNIDGNDTQSVDSLTLGDVIQNNPLHFIITEEKSLEHSIDMEDLSDLLSKVSTEDIHKEVSIQEELIFQTSKAINFCNRNKNFTFGMEKVEAERLLLIASAKKEVLLRELKNQDRHDESQDSTNCFVRISNISFPFKYNHLEDPVKDVSTFFVCLLTCGTKVIASPLLKAKEGYLKIPTEYLFKKLNSHFRINILVYALQVNNKKPAVKKTKKSFASPKKLFQMARNHCQKNVINIDDSVVQTSFVLWSQMTIDKQNIHDDCHKLTAISKLCQLNDSFFMHVESEVNLKSDVSGFLTIANYDGSGLIWSRRWCSLEGCRLKYWNYPSEELTKAPMGIIDLQYCISKNIGQADRAICPRQKVLQIQTKNKDIITNHLLSCDNQDEFLKWQQQLNRVIDFIKQWNVGAL